MIGTHPKVGFEFTIHGRVVEGSSWVCFSLPQNPPEVSDKRLVFRSRAGPNRPGHGGEEDGLRCLFEQFGVSFSRRSVGVTVFGFCLPCLEMGNL
ncbi:hypothetical protein Acr_29g0002030 [Actinidia rufa]|uniref:Uncharacterized protein n=1 Tax=Actinidia rufa TaxID=165716 RepID=A0A7J0HDJ8_9ERIC|nr:hypothetical protein Acr_29g0002030 [Actinidia rufa]